MNRKIVFFDIDGTLSTEDTFTIPESTLKALALARSNGHLMFINTGRCNAFIEKQIKNLDVDGFICGLGTDIYYQGKEIFYHPLPLDLCKKIIDVSIACRLENVLESRDGVYYPEHLRDPMNIHFRERYMNQGFNVKDYHAHDVYSFDKMACWYFTDSDIETFKKTFANDLTFIQRADNFVENAPKGYSKATGIQKIIEYLGIPWENTISVGDSTNDLAMLEYTKESIAMGNSNPAIFDHVTYKTSDINDDGIYRALKHFKLF